MSGHTRAKKRRRLMLLRLAPLAIVAVLAFAAGISVAERSPERDAVERFASAWAAGDYDAMYAELRDGSRAEFTREEFEAAYEETAKTATTIGVASGEAQGPLDDQGTEVVAVDLDYEMGAFGTLSGDFKIPVEDGGVAWSPALTFPGLREGESLKRKTRAPERAPILAADRTPIAEGPADARQTLGSGGILAGEMGTPPEERAREMDQQGFPDGLLAGNSGLELAFDGELAGTPGGKLLATGPDGRRELAQRDPIPGKPLRTTIDPAIQDSATAALGGRFGGVAVLDARKGDVLGVAGIAFSAPQPPGSTMKIITVAGGLEEGITSPDQEYEVVSSAIVGGRELDNSEEHLCGGTLVRSFADSCNTVFAPMGIELGNDKLVEISEKFGFNSPPTLYEEDALAATQPPPSTIPDPIGTDIEIAVSAIGQGRVLATPLQMASVSQAIANDGVRSPTALVKDPELAGDWEPERVVSPKVADQVTDMMIEVVKSGTGSAAAVEGAQVAGKTGTAELGPKAGSVDPDNPSAEPELEVDAWFTAFAPADKPKLAVAVMIVNADGDGGVIAAPIAKQILADALG